MINVTQPQKQDISHVQLEQTVNQQATLLSSQEEKASANNISLTVEYNKSPFDQICHEDHNGEYWSARELQPILGYKQWRQFRDTIERAKLGCQNTGISVSDHFADIRKPIVGGKGAVQNVEDYRLTRYACYLTAMNGDPRKVEIAAAQTYFAVKTRQAEIQQQNKAMTPLEILQHQVAVMTDHENRLNSLETEVNQLRNAHNGMSLRHELTDLQQQQQLDRHETDIADIKVTISERSPRANIKALIEDTVRKYANTEFIVDYGHAYACFYQEVKAVIGFDVLTEHSKLQQRRKEEGWSEGKISKISKIDVIEEHPEIWSDVKILISNIREENNI